MHACIQNLFPSACRGTHLCACLMPVSNLPCHRRRTPLSFKAHDKLGTAGMDEGVPLKQDIARFYNYCLEPTRVDRGAPPFSHATVEGYLSTINHFIGFLHTIMGIQQQHWSLQLFSNQFFITAYIGFKLQNTVVRAVRVPGVLPSCNNDAVHAQIKYRALQ